MNKVILTHDKVFMSIVGPVTPKTFSGMLKGPTFDRRFLLSTFVQKNGTVFRISSNTQDLKLQLTIHAKTIHDNS